MCLVFRVPAVDSGRARPPPGAAIPCGPDARRWRRYRDRSVSEADGFTLVELLAVMLLLAILSGSAFGLVRGVHERAATAQARVELALLAQAIDSWRDRYGDYPPVTLPEELYECLTGRRGPQNNRIDPPDRTFIETTRFALRDSDPGATDNAVLDPWGQPYHYVLFTRTQGAHTARGFVVFSSGPDGRTKPDDPPASGPMAGEPDLTAPDNADNLYSNR